MTVNATLSVIVPVFNAGKTLNRCIDSILDQHVPDLDLILVDDGSADNSLEICYEYAQNCDYGISVIALDDNRGPGAARNAGIEKARGRFITFVDADDYLAPGTYADNLTLLERNCSAKVLQFPIVKLKDHPEKRSVVSPTILSGRSSLYAAWLNESLINTYFWCKIFRRDVFEHIRFQETIIFEDRFLMCDVLNLCGGIFLSEIGTVFHTYSHDSITGKEENAYALISKTIADLHIVENVKDLSGLSDKYLERYFNCIHYLRKLANLGRDEKSLTSLVLKRLPSLHEILISKAPRGIKFVLLMIHLTRHV